MAERIVTSLLPKLSSLALGEANFLRGVDNQIMYLHDELQLINSFLRDADQKRRRNERVDIWVSQVRNLAYDAEDIIDLFMLKVEKEQQRNIGLRFIGYPKHLFTLHKMGNQVEDINRRIQKISTDKSKYGIEPLQAEETTARLNDGLARNVRRAPIAEEHEIVGFEKDIKEVAMLLKQGGARHLLVVSIVGMGGAGKSTLAKTIYNKSDVKNTFDFYAWIYVSQEYSIKDLLSEAITQVMGLKKKELETKNKEELGEMLSNVLKERRCLLVFDDVWRKEDWDALKEAFLAQDGRQPKRVLLTTRNMEVAKHADPLSEPHELSPLGDEDSFNLFSQKVFQFQERSEERSYPKELEELGRKLVARCGGLPLAIVVLGGLLSTKQKTPTVWTIILESLSWQLNHGPVPCMDILALSYTNLPYYLQSCFLYFGIFPEDYKIPSKKLIQLWVAEGFIQQRGDAIMEDVAEEYLEELIQRSMIQTASRRSDGGVETCRIHDLLRDLAVSEAKKDKLVEIYGNNRSTSVDRFRWFAIHPNNGTHNISSSTLSHLHSLLCFNIQNLPKKLWEGLYVGFNLLRVLDLGNAYRLSKLPNEIGELLLLKYLNLSWTRLRGIPSSMGNLLNLQTLHLSSPKLRHIPKEIWRMQQLRHLHCQGNIWLQSESSLVERIDEVVYKIDRSCLGPPRIDNLRDLQTLSLKAGSWIEGGLEKLTNLRDLMISGDLRLHTKALSNSIIKMKKLRVLHLSVDEALLPHISFSHHVHLYHMYLDGPLEKIPQPEDFPPYLTELELVGSQLKQDDQPMVTIEKLPNLKILELRWKSFEGKEMICSCGGFRKLQKLKLEGLHKLENLKVEQGAIPCLEVFTIHECYELKMLPDGLRHVTTLQELNISLMPKEFSARVQGDTGEDWEKIKHIPSVSITGTLTSMFQAMVLKVDLPDERVTTKAISALFGVEGVRSIGLGDTKGKKLIVNGEGMDAVVIVRKLRKFCHTEIDFIWPAKKPEEEEGRNSKEEPKKEKPKTEEEKKEATDQIAGACQGM